MTAMYQIIKSPEIEQGCIYRTTPYQYVSTAPYVNTTQTVAELLNNNAQITIIKPLMISTKPDQEEEIKKPSQ